MSQIDDENSITLQNIGAEIILLEEQESKNGKYSLIMDIQYKTLPPLLYQVTRTDKTRTVKHNNLDQ